MLDQIAIKTISGADASLGDYRGKVCLVVNVASQCGLTPQYDALEALYRRYRDQGFVVLGFPANDFGAQEPGSNAEIAEFCRTNYSVDFPMFSKIAINGAERHPLYAAMIAARPAARFKDGSEFVKMLAGYGFHQAEPTDVLWNFEKFLIGRDGQVIDRFAPDTEPDHPMLVAAIEAALRA